MAKAHEAEGRPARTLTPEEQARRKAVMEGGDPLKTRSIQAPSVQTTGTGPAEGFAQRVERATATISPVFIDYDRDGYPDAIVGRSGRNLRQRALARNRAGRPVVYGNSGAGLGLDSYRQDQMGYRDRLRGRIAAAAKLAEAHENDEEVDPRIQSMGLSPVLSHGGTGVPGGVVVPPPETEASGMVPRLTPTQQAIAAPRNPSREKPPWAGGPGGARKQRDAEEGEGEGEAPPVTPGNQGPFGTVRRTSFGSVPVQGTAQEDGSFVVGGTAQPPDTVPAKDSAKVTHTRTVERTTTVEPAKGHEHAKPHEHTKPHEPGKPPEHKK